MSGPVSMSLGPYAFEALGFSYTDVSRSLDTSWAEIAVANRFDVLQWTGPKSDTATIKGVLFPLEFGGAGSLEGIRSAATSGRPLMLVSRGGRIYGNFVVERVSEDRGYHDRNGTPRQNAYEIHLKAYGGTPGGLGEFRLTLGGVLSLIGL